MIADKYAEEKEQKNSLKEKDKVINTLLKRISNLEFEVERLERVVNKFDEWLLGEQMMFYRGDDGERLIRFVETKNKWLELKESEVKES